MKDLDKFNRISKEFEGQTIDDPYHLPDSPYYGLPIKQQRMLSVIRRGRRKTPKVISKQRHKATELDYGTILTTCVNYLLYFSEDITDVRLDRIKVQFLLPHNYRNTYKNNWPKGIALAYYDWEVLVEYNVNTIIDYLYEIGFCAYKAKELRKHLWVIKAEQEKFDWISTYFADMCVAEFLNDEVVNADKRPDRAKRGRRTYRKRSSIFNKDNPDKAIDNTEGTCENSFVGSEAQEVSVSDTKI